MSKTISANTIVARTQLTSQGALQVNGPVICAPDTTITIGNQKIQSSALGLVFTSTGSSRLIIGSAGVCIDGGFYFQANPSAIITGITTDIAHAGARDLATAVATKEYVDAQLLNASFDSISAREIHAQDARGIAFNGAVTFNARATFNGTISYSSARITADLSPVTHTVTTAIVFVCSAREGGIVDVRAQDGVVAQFINTEMNTTNIPALLRFDCGCAWLDGAMKIIKHNSSRWACLSFPDAFFPTRVAECAEIEGIIASSAATDAFGCVAIICNAMDAGERGCAHVFYRAESTWKRACPKVVGSCVLATHHQGLFCAINACARVFATANEREIWIFALDDTRQPFYAMRAREIAHLTRAQEIAGLRFNSRGTTLVVAGRAPANASAVYDASDDGTWVCRFTSQDFHAPIALSGDGAICYAIAADSIVRATLGSTSATTEVVAPADAVTQLACDVTGTVWDTNCASSARMFTRVSRDGNTLIIAHDNAERARIIMPCGITSFILSSDGALALILLESGATKIIY
jgi:hypothetical protein